MPKPPTAAAARDLSDDEFAELDELLLNAPEPLQALNAVMVDGFLCGVLVQPVLLPPDAWLPYVLDEQGRPVPEGADGDWLPRVRTLVLRRHAALNRLLSEDGWFDPFILEHDDELPPKADDPWADLGPIMRAMLPWSAGFHCALEQFPALGQMTDDAVFSALARVLRHLPAESEDEKKIVDTLDREQPLATLDDAIEDLVLAVADLNDLTRDQRYKVETHQRETPKVGRNDPCPCGSGKKYKHCHGA